jgi:hypothetical protein
MAAAGCSPEDGYVPAAGTCTYVKPDGGLPMAAAELACIRMGGHLASLHSDAANDAVMAAGGAGAWIGFHDMLQEVGCTGNGNSADDYDAGFVWTDGSTTDYTNWAGGEPNDWNGSTAGGANCDQATNGAGGEDCTHMRGDGLWNDAGCDGARGYICETCAAAAPPPDPSACAFTGVSEQKSMMDAELHCVNLSGHLASIHGDAQQAAMEAAAGQMRLADFWIGFNDMDFESGSNGG